MRRIRLLLVWLPTLLRDILSDAVARAQDMEIVATAESRAELAGVEVEFERTHANPRQRACHLRFHEGYLSVAPRFSSSQRPSLPVYTRLTAK